MKRMVSYLLTAVLLALTLCGCYSYADEDYSLPEPNSEQVPEPPIMSSGTSSGPAGEQYTGTEAEFLTRYFNRFYREGVPVDFYYVLESSDGSRPTYDLSLTASALTFPEETPELFLDNPENVLREGNIWCVLELELEARERQNWPFYMPSFGIYWVNTNYGGVMDAVECTDFYPRPVTDNPHDGGKIELQPGEKEHFTLLYQLPKECKDKLLCMVFNPWSQGWIGEDKVFDDKQKSKWIAVQVWGEDITGTGPTSSGEVLESGTEPYDMGKELEQLGIRTVNVDEPLRLFTVPDSAIPFDATITVTGYEVMKQLPDVREDAHFLLSPVGQPAFVDAEGKVDEGYRILQVDLQVENGDYAVDYLMSQLHMVFDGDIEGSRRVNLYGMYPYQSEQEGGDVVMPSVHWESGMEETYNLFYLIPESALKRKASLWIPSDRSIRGFDNLQQVRNAIQIDNIEPSLYGMIDLWEKES